MWTNFTRAKHHPNFWYSSKLQTYDQSLLESSSSLVEYHNETHNHNFCDETKQKAKLWS